MRFERLLKAVYENKKLVFLLKTVSLFAVAVSALSFAADVSFLYVKEGFAQALCLLLAAGIPFVAVSIFRIVINAKRPYEYYTFYEKKPKEKLGRSFPSRHVFSVFIIGVLTFKVCVIGGSVLLALGFLLGAARVLLGIHFLRDVIAGALCGAFGGLVGLLIFF